MHLHRRCRTKQPQGSYAVEGCGLSHDLHASRRQQLLICLLELSSILAYVLEQRHCIKKDQIAARLTVELGFDASVAKSQATAVTRQT